MKNILNRNVPENYGFKPFIGANETVKNTERVLIEETISTNTEKKIDSLKEVFDVLGIKDGMTLSFHHHMRNGDYVLNMVMAEVKERGLKDLTLAPSSIFPSQEPLVELIENGTVTNIYTNYINGPVAKAISAGKLQGKFVMNTHGGRPRAIESGELPIDVAFVAVPTSDINGNGNGMYGPSACGVLGYAIPDVMYAKKVVVITDNLVDEVDYKEIDGKYVDYVLVVDKIGDAKGIVSGTTKVTRDPIGLLIARNTAQLLDELGMIKNGMSFQTGAGGTSLAVADEVKKIMVERGIKGSFASGGITGYFTSMLEEGLFEYLEDVQCFDLDAIESFKNDRRHKMMSSSKYGNPYDPEVVVNGLDFVILGATEIDKNFNVNVTTGSDGSLMGGSGGHSDTAYGAKVTVITTNLMKSRTPIVKESVTTCTTPGETVDVLVTERGIAINPLRTDLLEKVKDSKLNIMTMEELMALCYKYTGVPQEVKRSEEVIGAVMYRDGTIIDTLYKVEEK